LLSKPFHINYLYSSQSEKLKTILQKIAVQTDGGKSAPLLDSGMIAGQNIDETNNKVTISLNLSKDYRKIKALLKTEL